MTISAELPPSSRCTRLRCWAPSEPTLRPAAVDPVKAMTRTGPAVTTASPTSAPPGSTLSSPGASPASSKTRARITPPLTTVRGSGFKTTALPRARAGATDRMDRISGKLKGAITPTTPTGMRREKLRRGISLRRIDPVGCDARAAASKHSSAATWTSRSALGPMPPVSRMIQPASSDALSTKSWPARRSTAARSLKGRAAHCAWAAAATVAASATSSALARPAFARVAPVAGSTTGASPPRPGRQPLSEMLPCHGAPSRIDICTP